MRSLSFFSGLVAALALSACGASGPNVVVQLAPGFERMPLRASVLGVYREGRFEADGLRPLGADFTQSVFHADACSLAYDAEKRAVRPQLASALDEATRTEGITEGLLGALAPAAEGDVIVFVTMAGQVRTPEEASASRATAVSGAVGGAGQGGPAGGMGRGPGSSRRGAMTPVAPGPRVDRGDERAFELTASVYAIKQRRIVAEVALGYGGASLPEALGAFREKLAATFPGSTCTGWKDDAWPTEDELRRSTAGAF